MQRGLIVLTTALASLALSSLRAAAEVGATAYRDLAQSELKRGRLKAAVRAARKAVQLGDESVRESAYEVLGRAHAGVKLTRGRCRALPNLPELECKKPLFACVTDWSRNGTGVGRDGTIAFFSSVRARAEEASKAFADGPAGYFVLEASVLEDAAVMSEEQRCFGWCANRPFAKCTDDCKQGNLLQCEIVSGDACNGRVGIVCSERDEIGNKPTYSATELDLNAENRRISQP